MDFSFWARIAGVAVLGLGLVLSCGDEPKAPLPVTKARAKVANNNQNVNKNTLPASQTEEKVAPVVVLSNSYQQDEEFALEVKEAFIDDSVPMDVYANLADTGAWSAKDTLLTDFPRDVVAAFNSSVGLFIISAGPPQTIYKMDDDGNWVPQTSEKLVSELPISIVASYVDPGSEELIIIHDGKKSSYDFTGQTWSTKSETLPSDWPTDIVATVALTKDKKVVAFLASGKRRVLDLAKNTWEDDPSADKSPLDITGAFIDESEGNQGVSVLYLKGRNLATYTLQTGKWSEKKLRTSEWPENISATYPKPATNQVVIFGQNGNEMRLYDLEKKTWVPGADQDVPPAQAGNVVAAYVDPTNNQIVLIKNTPTVARVVYDPEKKTWSPTETLTGWPTVVAAFAHPTDKTVTLIHQGGLKKSVWDAAGKDWQEKDVSLDSAWPTTIFATYRHPISNQVVVLYKK